MKLLANRFERRPKPLLLAALLLLLPLQPVFTAETLQHGAPVYPAFEGWRPNPDGSFNLMFGYMNENWGEQPFEEIGENVTGKHL